MAVPGAQPSRQPAGRLGPGPHPHARHEPAGHTHAAGDMGGPPTKYEWKVYHPFEGVADRAAVEVAPKTGLLSRWRFVVPDDYPSVKSWGVGPPGGGPISVDVKRAVKSGPTRLVNGPSVVWFGGHDVLSSQLSAYLVFEGAPPHYMAFGQAEEPGGPPHGLEGITFSAHHHPSAPHGAPGHEAHGTAP